jgi:hypothetical protein
MGHLEPSRSGGFCLRSGFPHTTGQPDTAEFRKPV